MCLLYGVIAILLTCRRFHKSFIVVCLSKMQDSFDLPLFVGIPFFLPISALFKTFISHYEDCILASCYCDYSCNRLSSSRKEGSRSFRGHELRAHSLSVFLQSEKYLDFLLHLTVQTMDVS